MNTNHIIYLDQYRAAIPSCTRRVQKAARKAAPSTALCLIENAVTATIGLCVLFSMILVVTML